MDNFDGTLFLLFLFGLGYFYLSLRFSKPKGKDQMAEWSSTMANSKKFKNVQIQKNIKTRFADVAGLREAKQEITEFVDFLKHPEKYHEMGARIPRGALLSGPPGTGKTLLAKACAGESKVPFVYVSGSEFVEMFVGVGAQRVRELFEAAKKSAPAIIFIDEIDSIGRKRSFEKQGSSEESNTLNQILVEMDGFGTSEEVVVFAATNRKDLLDDALVRPGRFDRDIVFSLPDLAERAEIFNVHLNPIKVHPGLDKDQLSRRLSSLTPGFSGADIHNVCNESAILAVRDEGENILQRHFEQAVDKTLAGVERPSLSDPEQERVVAVHESGHAAVSWFLEGAQPLLKVTIVPRSKGALGFAQYMVDEGGMITREQMQHEIATILAGRIAEEEFFGRVTTGAYDDLQKAKRKAELMVTKLGMIGDLRSVQDDMVGRPKHSDRTQEEIDYLIGDIIKEAAVLARKLIKENREKIEKLSQRLLEEKTLDLRQIIEVLGERQFEIKENVARYLEAIEEIKENTVQEEKIEEKKEAEKLDEDDDFFDFGGSENSTVVEISL